MFIEREEEKIDNAPKCSNCGAAIPEGELKKLTIKCCTCGYPIVNQSVQFDDSAVLPLPDVAIKWVRGQEWIKFSRPFLILAYGVRGGAKSSLLEVWAARYPKIIDCLEANDGEALCWCKPEFKKVWRGMHGSDPKILLLTGLTKKVVCEWDTLQAKRLVMSDIENYDVIIFCHKFFEDEEEYFASLFDIIHMIWEERVGWSIPWLILIREAANWLYARTKVVRDDKFAKAEFIKFLREARHKGIAVGIDTLRWTNIDKEGRDLADYTFIKKTGRPNLPDELRWLYRIFKVYSFRKMKKDRFILLTSEENIGIGKFEKPQWHKEEEENIFKILNIEIVDIDKGGNMIENSADKTFEVGMIEHSTIIQKYKENKSMMKVASAVSRSPRTIQTHINQHNENVQLYKECLPCARAQSPLSKELIAVTKRKRR